MKNENKQAMPVAYGENDFPIEGLSKLEYAVIHIAAGLIAGRECLHSAVPSRSITIAKQIFEQLEDDNTPAVSGIEL